MANVDDINVALAKMQIIASKDQEQHLLEFVQLLAKWSSVYNLTSIKSVAQIIPLHILDSLSMQYLVRDTKYVLDVGTGAGLPGIPLAIMNPNAHFTLVDSQQKKINFVQHVITSLGLKNVTAEQSRVEKLQVSYPFDMVVSRAFASLDEFVKLIINVCDKHTKIVAMKAKQVTVMQELQLLPPTVELVNIDNVVVPGVVGERCLVLLKKT